MGMLKFCEIEKAWHGEETRANYQNNSLSKIKV